QGEQEIARKFARWTGDYHQNLQRLDPDMGGLFNRLADNWRPLFAIADLAGGKWPALAREAATALSSAEPDADSMAVQLLIDVCKVFDDQRVDRLPTENLIGSLLEDKSRPWCEFGRSGKPITDRGLARLLGRFGIIPNTVRMPNGKTPRGYMRD